MYTCHHPEFSLWLEGEYTLSPCQYPEFRLCQDGACTMYTRNYLAFRSWLMYSRCCLHIVHMPLPGIRWWLDGAYTLCTYNYPEFRLWLEGTCTMYTCHYLELRLWLNGASTLCTFNYSGLASHPQLNIPLLSTAKSFFPSHAFQPQVCPSHELVQSISQVQIQARLCTCIMYRM
jgi:hypothetical protein